MSIRQAVWRASGKWKQLGSGSVNRRIFQAMITVGGLTFAVKIVGMLNSAITASLFGTGDAMDAYLIAFLLPGFICNVISGAFNTALIPVYIEVRENEGKEASQRLLSGIVVLSVGILVALCLLLALCGPYLLRFFGAHFAPHKLALALSLFYIILPIIVLNVLVTLWGAALNAGERFALTTLAPLASTLVSIGALLAFGKTWGIYVLPYSLVVGAVLQLAMLARGLKKQGINLRLRWYGLDPRVKQVIGQYFPTLAAAFLVNSNTIVDQTMAARLGPGSVATLSYGNRLIMLVWSIGIGAVGTVALPYFSKMIAVRDWAGVRHSLRTYTRLIILITVPFTFLACIFSRPLIALLFQRGHFTATDTLLVSRIQVAYLLQVPVLTLEILFIRLISSLQANIVIVWGSVISCIFNIGLDLLLMRYMGIVGIALSTTIVYTICCIYFWATLHKKLKHSELKAYPYV